MLRLLKEKPETSRVGVVPPLWLRQGFLLSTLLVFFFNPLSALAFEAPGPDEVPASITVEGKQYNLKNLSNPLWKDESKIPEAIKQGSDLYFKHCALCHGDLLNGRGYLPTGLIHHPQTFINRGLFSTARNHTPSGES